MPPRAVHAAIERCQTVDRVADPQRAIRGDDEGARSALVGAWATELEDLVGTGHPDHAIVSDDHPADVAQLVPAPSPKTLTTPGSTSSVMRPRTRLSSRGVAACDVRAAPGCASDEDVSGPETREAPGVAAEDVPAKVARTVTTVTRAPRVMVVGRLTPGLARKVRRAISLGFRWPQGWVRAPCPVLRLSTIGCVALSGARTVVFDCYEPHGGAVPGLLVRPPKLPEVADGGPGAGRRPAAPSHPPRSPANRTSDIGALDDLPGHRGLTPTQRRHHGTHLLGQQDVAPHRHHPRPRAILDILPRTLDPWASRARASATRSAVVARRRA